MNTHINRAHCMSHIHIKWGEVSPHISSPMGWNMVLQHSAPTQPFAEQAALFLISQKNKYGKSNYTLTHIASRAKLSQNNKTFAQATNVMINETGWKCSFNLSFRINFQPDTQEKK